MCEKILGKYHIIKRFEENGEEKFQAKAGNKDYIKFYTIIAIKKADKELDNATVSHTAQQFSSLSHPNISHLKLDEDQRYFYLIKQEEEEVQELDTQIFKKYNEQSRYKKLLECYLQIFKAIEYIHKQGFYHGNINPGNILVNEDNHIFLLDFGKSYFYESLHINKATDKCYYAPEQLENINDKDKSSDIYSFGLVMLKLLLDNFEDKLNFEELYKSPKDLEKVFKKIRQEYELEKIENDLFVLIQKMTLKKECRIALEDLQTELRKIYRSIVKYHCFEINLSKNVIENYKNLEDIPEHNVTSHLQGKVENHAVFWSFGEDKQGKEEIKIACGNLMFCCSTKENPYLFCFSILDNPKKIDDIEKEGIRTEDSFKITRGQGHCEECDDVQDYKDELQNLYRKQKIRNQRKKIDAQAIKSEEELLEAEYKWLESKKNTHKAEYKNIQKDKDTITLKLINNTKEQKEKQDQNKKELKTKVDKNIFKPKDKVCIKLKDFDDVRGLVESYSADTQELIVKLGHYESLRLNENIEDCSISHDYQIEEILYSKRNRALNMLKSGSVRIPNLLRKINEPSELAPNELIEIKDFEDTNLDENQQEAVKKALSLEEGCELLLIQGPPGTGKTTTITEILKQIMKRHRHYKILVCSQSNQAVDNVLEKITQIENKILRIGNDENRMSDEAKKFTPQKVLNKLIQDTRERIKNNPISFNNEAIQEKLRTLQNEFDKTLQTISAEMAQKDKSKESELATLFTKNIRLIFGTLLGISSWNQFRDIVFDVAIVDEAGRATLSELLVPCIKAKKIILVGDHKQLAPVIDDEITQHLPPKTIKKEVSTSLFERYFKKLETAIEKDSYLECFKHRLIYNYRAEERICELYNQPFYGGELRTKEFINESKKHHLGFKGSVMWLDTGKLSNKEDKLAGTGKKNHCNAENIKEALKNILEQIKKLNSKTIQDIGVITPYKAQKDLLNAELKNIKKEFKEQKINLDIGTVDSFQGSDRDIIVYDCVRSSKNKNNPNNKGKGGNNIDFIADEKRLNVSLSRAKKLLIIVGDREFLRTSNVRGGSNPFEEILDFMDNNKEKYEIIELKDYKGV